MLQLCQSHITHTVKQKYTKLMTPHCKQLPLQICVPFLMPFHHLHGMPFSLSLQNFSQETSRFVALNYLLGKSHFLYASIAPHENPLLLPLPFDAEIVHYSIILLLVLEFLKIICYVPFTFLSPAFTLKSSTL